jgi:hypothetical protein
MRLFNGKKGMAAMIVTIAILGLLMATSTAFVKIIQTELQVANSLDRTDRAMDAAFSGIQYGMGIVQVQDELFIDDAIEARKRIYMAEAVSDPAVTSLWGAISPTTAVSYPNLVQSDWVYLNEDLTFMDDDDAAYKPYLYRIAIYPKNDGSNSIQTDGYYIKSQGKYLMYDDVGTVLMEYKFQMIAEIQINFLRKKQRLIRWKRQDWPSSDADFFTYEEF